MDVYFCWVSIQCHCVKVTRPWSALNVNITDIVKCTNMVKHKLWANSNINQFYCNTERFWWQKITNLYVCTFTEWNSTHQKLVTPENTVSIYAFGQLAEILLNKCTVHVHVILQLNKSLKVFYFLKVIFFCFTVFFMRLLYRPLADQWNWLGTYL